jgi:hypothetical protein
MNIVSRILVITADDSTVKRKIIILWNKECQYQRDPPHLSNSPRVVLARWDFFDAPEKNHVRGL